MTDMTQQRAQEMVAGQNEATANREGITPEFREYGFAIMDHEAQTGQLQEAGKGGAYLSDAGYERNAPVVDGRIIHDPQCPHLQHEREAAE